MQIAIDLPIGYPSSTLRAMSYLKNFPDLNSMILVADAFADAGETQAMSENLIKTVLELAGENTQRDQVP